MLKPEQIPGASTLIKELRGWPSFHDSEILEVHLSRSGRSWITLQVQNGAAICQIQINFANITSIDLHDFNHQNVISGLEIAATDDVFEIVLLPSFGLSGSIVAEALSIEWKSAGNG